uniref:Uncharacterized protein n=1 Tax=Romanomermis culicivorax TaxID=13658 RepID=A0A915KS20_ROMCU
MKMLRYIQYPGNDNLDEDTVKRRRLKLKEDVSSRRSFSKRVRDAKSKIHNNTNNKGRPLSFHSRHQSSLKTHKKTRPVHNKMTNNNEETNRYASNIDLPDACKTFT